MFVRMGWCRGLGEVDYRDCGFCDGKVWSIAFFYVEGHIYIT